jgi:Flp pilus assembly pilin Flp
MFGRYLRSISGQGMSEYLILVLLIAVGSIAAAKSIGSTVYSKLDEIHSKLQDVNFGDVQGGQSGHAHGGGSTSGGSSSGTSTLGSTVGGAIGSHYGI